MILADPLYTSGTFWGAAGAIAVLVTGAVATWVAFVLANPVRRLQCVMSAAPLLKAPPQGVSGLQITWDGTELREPNVLDVSITNRGRRDITGDDFDLKQPLEFRVHAKILAILGTSTTSNSTAFSAVVFDDDVLKVGPGLIPRRQTIKFTLLAIGAEPALSSAAAALREVKVDVLTEDESHRRKPGRFRAAAGLAASAAVAGLVLTGLLIGHELLPRTGGSPGQAAVASSTAATAPAQPAASVVAPATVSPQLASALRTGEMDLASRQAATQLGGLGILQSVLRSGTAEQPAVLSSVAKFIRDRSPSGDNDQPITPVIQAAVNVLRARNPAADDGTLIDLSNANLTNADLTGITLNQAILANTDFDGAVLSSASLQDANLNYAFLGGASLTGANLTGANLAQASLYQTTLCRGATPTEAQRGYNCSANG